MATDPRTGLTDQQELFCQLYVKNNTASNKENYLTAYPNSAEKSGEANASRLLKNPKIIKRINELLDEMKDDCEINDKAIVRRLKEIAFSSRNDMASLKALSMLGTITGLFGENKATTNNVIMISVDDKDKVEQKQLEDNNNGQIIGSNFNIVVDDNDEE